MIESRFIEKLLNGRKVEWKSLEDIAEIYGGLSGKTKSDFENGNAKYITYKNVFDNIEINFDILETVKITQTETQHKVKYGDVLFTASSETANDVGMSSVVTKEIEYDVYLNSFSFGLRFNENIKIIPEYSKYLFRTYSIRNEISKTASGVTRFNISKARFKKIIIPIPPIDVQQEIVRILDAFTSLTAELTAELTSRQKQYQYFKEHLLNINNNIVWKSLSEITITTKNIKWENNKKNYRYIDLTSVNRENNRITETIEINAKNAPSRAQKIIEKNDILFATTRPTQQRMTIVPEEYDSQIASTGYCVLRPNKEEVLPEWIYYNISTIDFKNYVEEYQSGSAYPAISDYKVKEYKIPIPSIQMQEKLISILNRFEELTHSIEAGLPNEIQLRKQQYEYYRNMLLNFK
ncbi:restriction endonuclease subunit S [Glaesserella parasuis]|uniref:restriction endonuclease subunit S n=1 Tax=Glaesserella parasuis TaxID=738 RepID=UPI0013181B93|nr:restriction endonuclease subunit S [Glaesserella parasuis]MDG6359055.1 restriction endonuclease subunit S [Glaesserella parasuis]QHB44738.1 restriction endonuclease subunit S [Glaesserella parasuis]